MSSDLLRRAVVRLRSAACNATPGPWADFSTTDDGAWPRLLVGPVREGDDPQSAPDVIKVHESALDDGTVSRADLAWIALASPAIAEPLARLLDEAADRYDLVTRQGSAPEQAAVVVAHETAIARLVLGEDR